MQNQPIETRHPLSEGDRVLEQQVLSELLAYRTNFKGTFRELYDEMTAQTPIAPDIRSQRVEEQSATGWWVLTEEAAVGRAIVFIHGGAYMLGSAEAYRGVASQLVARTGVASFVLDYPLAPEYPFPAAPKVTERAIGWLAEQGVKEIALVGDSAGGALALSALAGSQAASLTRSVVVFSPWVDLAFEGNSFNDPSTHDPVFQGPMLINAAQTYLNGQDPRNSLASPLYGLPETLPPLAVQVGTDELLLDDAVRYAHAAALRGGTVYLDIYDGVHHVFQRSIQLAAARHALDAAAGFIDKHWRNSVD